MKRNIPSTGKLSRLSHGIKNGVLHVLSRIGVLMKWGLFALLSSAVAWAVIRRHDRQRKRELSAREAEQERNGGA